MADTKKSVADRVAELIAPAAESLGLKVWDVFFGKEGQDKVLRITIDKEGGVFIDDCEAMSRAADPLLDQADIIDGAYSFEVSSPGLGRKLRTDAHFTEYLGRGVKVKLIKADEEGNREYSGILESFDRETFTVHTDDRDITAKRASASFVKADDDIDF